MCGIAGYMNKSGEPADPEIATRMSDALVHRGPDDSGVWTSGSVALAHRRLSIVDVSRGHQPMRLSDAEAHIVYNGEVYNHAELRRELSRQPSEFETHCDTETVLAAYAEWGEAALDRLRGMFAFAVYDPRDETLFLARDRLGIKPLYYFETPQLFVFASEIKALLVHPAVAARPNLSKLPVQLGLKYTLNDETLFEGVRVLPPAHFMRLRRRASSQTQRYWNLSFEPKQRFRSLGEAAEAFGERFHESVSVRRMADVPLGVFLSGGLDSSSILAVMAGMVEEPIRSFSVSYAGRAYDESAYSREAAERAGAIHREILPTAQEWLRAWPHMVHHEDEPIAHPSSISLHFVSKLAAEDVKVVLSGEGADELLGGYERYYQTLWNLRLGRRVPDRVRSLAARAIDLFPDNWTTKQKAIRTALYLEANLESLFLDNYAAMSRSAVDAALFPQVRSAGDADPYARFDDLMQASDARELLDRLLYVDIETYLVELLMKQDQMSMSASLESRVPFLDHPLVEFVARLPIEYKIRGLETKRVLRKAAANWVPRSILERGKMGFPTPTRLWFRREFQGLMRQLLLAPDSRIAAYVDPAFTRQALSLHASGRRDLEERIWTLGNLELWLRIFIDELDPREAWPEVTRSVEASP